MSVKYIFVTGGVVSGLGKGITAASLGRLFKARGYKVTMQKFDPYLNMDPGMMNPMQHGEVFVTGDGAECDLDIGHYERFINESLTKNANVTAGKIYWSVLNKERKGEYGGGTVQVIPHITNEIKSKIYLGSKDLPKKEVEISIIEIGGTVGDIESQPFIEAVRQFKHEIGPGNAINVHVTLMPYIKSSEELKTKPTQMSVKTLQGMGLQPDIIVCRTEHELDAATKGKIALFCNVPKENVITNADVDTLYEVPIALEEEGIAEAALKALHLPAAKPNLTAWKKMISNWKNPKSEITVGLVGKYVAMHDAYLSVVEALRAAGAKHQVKVNIEWIDSEKITKSTVNSLLKKLDGIIVPGGFGKRSIENIMLAVRYAREKKIPYLGICLGLQLATIEFARNVLGLEDANSSEFNPHTKNPVIDLLPEQIGIEVLGGTLRLGNYECKLVKGSKVYKLYGETTIEERHRHRYFVNNNYVPAMEEKGMIFPARSDNGRTVEMLEIKDHPFFIATQCHPEFNSRPDHPRPLFDGFVAAMKKTARKIK